MSTEALLRWGGLLCWLSELVYIVFDTGGRQQEIRQLVPLQFMLWLTAYVLFGAMYWWVTRRTVSWVATGEVQRQHRRLLACAGMTLSALIVNALYSSSADLGVLLVLVAALLPGLLSWRWTLLCIILQSAALAVVLHDQFTWGTALYTGVFMGGVQALTALLIQMLGDERQARKALAELNVSFRFTRAMLQQATREAERTRISRELHDSLGHHLTILSLELELASHLSGQDVHAPIRRASVLNRIILADVRESVSNLRGDSEDWKVLLKEITRDIPGLRVHLDISSVCINPPPLHAAALLRFAQEAVTNTIKHAHARNLWLSVHCTGCELTVWISDDGHVQWPVTPGNGLMGMHERIDELEGTLVLASSPQGGLKLEARFPITGAA